MKLMIVRTKAGTYIGQLKEGETIGGKHLDRTVIYYPAMVDFITMPVMSPIGRQEIKTSLHMANWPCIEMTIKEAETVLYSIIDDSDTSTVNAEFLKAYRECINQVWKSRRILS